MPRSSPLPPVRPMRNRVLRGLLVLLALGLASPAQTQNSQDPLQSLKDSLPQDAQSSILQGVLGDQNGQKKTDKKLETPDSVRAPSNEDIIQKNMKARDGRILRQFNEEPELRPDDTVMIELRSVDDVCEHNNLVPGIQNLANGPNNQQGGTYGAPGTAASAFKEFAGGREWRKRRRRSRRGRH